MRACATSVRLRLKHGWCLVLRAGGKGGGGQGREAEGCVDVTRVQSGWTRRTEAARLARSRLGFRVGFGLNCERKLKKGWLRVGMLGSGVEVRVLA